MEKFLYIFGYETPGLVVTNERLHTDFEDSMAFFIITETKEQALEWGNKLAEKYLEALYAKTDIPLEKKTKEDWCHGIIDEDGPFSAWSDEYIKKHPEEYALAVEKVNKISIVKVGEYSDMATLVRERYGPADLQPPK